MRSIPATILLIFVRAVLASAQEPVADTLLLKGVEIETGRVSRKEIVAFPLQSLSGLQVSAVMGHSVADALKTFSGVTLRDYGGAGGLKTVMVRSLGSQHTGVFIDGAPVSDIAGGQPDLGKFSLSNLEEVSLNVGGGGSGPLPARAWSSANLINLKGVSPDFAEYKTRGNFGFKAGSFGFFNPFLRLDHKTGPFSRIGFEINPLVSAGDYPYLVDNGPGGSERLKRSNADIKSLATNLYFAGRPTDSCEVRLALRFYNAERGLPGAVIFYNPYASQRLTNKDIHLNAQLSATKKRFSLLSNAGWSYAWLRYLDPDFLSYNKSLDNRYLQHEFYLSQAVAVNQGRKFSASLAADFILNTFSGNQYPELDPMRSTILLSAIMNHQSRNTLAEAGFIASMVSDREKKPDENQITRKLSPYLSFSVRLMDAPSLKFRMMYKHSFRMPAFNELYYALVGNSRLTPEHARQLNAGILGSYAYRSNLNFRISADAFFNRVHDKIIAIPTQNLFVWSMQNIGKVRTTGLDVQAGADVKINRRAKGSVSLTYTFQEAKDVSDTQSPAYGKQVPYIPFETFSTMLQMGYRAFALDYNLMFNGYRYVSSGNSQQDLLPSWWISDAGISWNLQRQRFSYKIKVGITNLFDKDYVFIKSFPMPGRGFTLSVTARF